MTAGDHSDDNACERPRARLIETHTYIHDAELRRGVAFKKTPWLTIKRCGTYYRLRLGYRLPYRINLTCKNGETSQLKGIFSIALLQNIPKPFALLKRNTLAGRLSSENRDCEFNEITKYRHRLIEDGHD
jgi:hypothetical protein